MTRTSDGRSSASREAAAPEARSGGAGAPSRSAWRACSRARRHSATISARGQRLSRCESARASSSTEGSCRNGAPGSTCPVYCGWRTMSGGAKLAHGKQSPQFTERRASAVFTKLERLGVLDRGGRVADFFDERLTRGVRQGAAGEVLGKPLAAGFGIGRYLIEHMVDPGQPLIK